MVSKIRVLDEDTINKIAAGEVIENPSSVVKELVENSLDAGSTEVTIEIKGGGRQLIRITDNGCGMNKDDALLCLERHATSKLREIHEIHTLGTMGFRGEAIPSIASISKFTLYTRVNSDEGARTPGTLILVNGGKITTCSDVECALGTTIEIKDLFFNVPVRKKFQKSPTYDIAEIQRIVTQLALGNPKIQFTLVSNGEIIISAGQISPELSFSDALKERIRQLLGSEIHDCLIPLQCIKGDYQLEGFIAHPSTHKHNRSGQHLFVNKRGVVVPLISFAVKDGYGTMLPTGRHPVFIFHLNMPPELIDVNVHPQKREVRLRQERLLKELISTSVQLALQNNHISYQPSFEPTSESSNFFEPSPSFGKGFSLERPSWNFPTIDPFSSNGDPFSADEECYPPYLKPEVKSIEPTFSHSTQKIEPPLAPIEQPLFFDHQNSESKSKKLKAIGVIEKYIVCTQDNSSELYFIDQRAAHSRILYEKMVENHSEHTNELQLLLIPHIINLSSSSATFLRSQLTTLQSAGIHIKEFGATSFAIEALPQIFGNIDIQKLLEEILECSYEGIDSNSLEKEQKRKLAQAASRAAIASNSRLSVDEAQHLLDELALCKQPKLCPNGKAVIITLTASDIAKLSSGHK